MAEPTITADDVVLFVASFATLDPDLQAIFVEMANAQVSSRVGASRVRAAKCYLAAHFAELNARALAGTGEVSSETFGAESIKIDYANAQNSIVMQTTAAGRAFLAVVGSSAASVGFSAGRGQSTC